MRSEKTPKLFLVRFKGFRSHPGRDEVHIWSLKRVPDGLATMLSDGLAPALARWADAQERRILRDGVALSGDALVFARSLGIERAEEIRVLVANLIPLPVPGWVVKVAQRCGLPVFAPAGMALGRGIFLLPGQEPSLLHELVHVLQYQRLGGTLEFMRRYIFECFTQGYFDADLEIEARQRSRLQK